MQLGFFFFICFFHNKSEDILDFFAKHLTAVGIYLSLPQYLLTWPLLMKCINHTVWLKSEADCILSCPKQIGRLIHYWHFSVF